METKDWIYDLYVKELIVKSKNQVSNSTNQTDIKPLSQINKNGKSKKDR